MSIGHVSRTCCVVLLTTFSASAQAQSVADILNPKSGKVIFVHAEKGQNSNAGTQDAPLKNVDKALAKAAKGDTIAVAGGRYTGTFSVGLWEFDKDLNLYGGFDPTFTQRDPAKYPTLLQPDEQRFDKSGVKPMFYQKDNAKLTEFVIDGFVFDQGFMTPYAKGEGQPEGVETGMMKTGPGARNPEAFCLKVDATRVRITHNVFVNCANYPVNVTVRADNKLEGHAEIAHNLFVANRMAAMMINGAAPAKKEVKGAAHIHHNTIIFSWSRTKDLGTHGYGVEVLTGIPYKIEDNIIALNIGPGIMSARFNQALEINRNVFWGNKRKDFRFSPKSNTDIMINATEFGDLEYPNAGNEAKMLKLPVDAAYAQGIISAQYSEKVDYDPDSEANRMRELFGLNKQGTIKSKVSMFANRYPWQKALELWNVGGAVGAALPK